MEKSVHNSKNQKFCSSCGSANTNKDRFCKNCGDKLLQLSENQIKENLVPKSSKTITKNKAVYSSIDNLAKSMPIETKKEEEDLNGLVKVLSFCFPFVGGLVYLNHKGSSPKKASAACSCALWGLGIGILINILTAVANG